MGELLHVARTGEGVTGQGAPPLAYPVFFSFATCGVFLKIEHRD